MESAHCGKCKKLITAEDLKPPMDAVELGGKILCANCLKTTLEALRPKAREAFRRRLRRIVLGGAPAEIPPEEPPEESDDEAFDEAYDEAFDEPDDEAYDEPDEEEEEEEEEDEEPEPPSRKSPRWRQPRFLYPAIGGAGLLVVIVVVLILVLGGGGKNGEVVEAPPSGSGAAEENQGPPQSMLDAREFVRLSPDDLDGQLVRYDKALKDTEGTPFHGELLAEREGILKRFKETSDAEFAKLVDRARRPYGTEAFSKAIAIWENAKGRYKAPEWTDRIDREIDQIRHRVETVFPSIKKEADRAVETRHEAALRIIHERVAHWGLPEYVEKLGEMPTFAPPEEGAVVDKPPDKPEEMPEPVPEPKERTEEGKAYLEAWKRAMSEATSRNYEKAIAALEEAGEDLGEKATKAEQAMDLKDLRSLIALHKRGREALAKRSRGQLVALKYRDTAGNDAEARGVVVESSASRIEIVSQKKPLFVEYSDLKAATVVGTLLKAKSRAAALLCLLEGDVETADGLGAGNLPAKYRAYAPDAIANAAAPDPDDYSREISARKLFYDAEVGYRSLETRGAAVGSYQSLIDDYAAAKIVQENLKHLIKRAASCREYLFGPKAIKGSGEFKRKKHEEVDCLLSMYKGESSEQENYVEVGFCALRGVKYRAWVRAGGCCQETFTFYIQATDLKYRNPRDRKEYAVEPDGMAAAPVKLTGVRLLKKTHASHAGRKEPTPKQPERWAWIPLELPEYPTPGLKKIRLLSSEPGFAVAHFYITSLAEAPPKDEELAKMEESTAVEAAQSVNVLPGGLVAYWSFDDGTAADVTGNGFDGRFEGTVSPEAQGKVGGALSFNGSGRVEVPDAPGLQITGDLTIALWAKPTGRNCERVVAKGNQKNYTYALGIGARRNARPPRFLQHPAGEQKPFQLDSGAKNARNQWAHLAVVVAGNEVRILVNGKTVKKGSRSKPPAASKGPLVIGQGFGGLIDDVRIYASALSDGEIKELMSK